MNASSISRDDPISENARDSDSDTNSDEISDYYQPITSLDGGDDPDAGHPISNGYFHHEENNGHDFSVANGVRSLTLSDDDEGDDVVPEEEEEEERRRVEMDSAMWRAFQEDESRRNAPLSSDNATRVMEAMRQISLAGSAPDWVHEDNWVHQLQRLRQAPSSRV